MGTPMLARTVIFFSEQYLLADKHIGSIRYASLAYVDSQAGECLKVNPFGG
jgi:hypothetical protein